MKKTLFSLLLLLTIYTSSVLPTYAIFCSNCQNVGQGFIQIAKQVYQIGKETITAAATSNTSIQVTLDNTNKYILQPMKDAMTLLTIAKSGDQIKNLIMGSLGTEALLVADPQKLFDDTVKDVKLAALGDIASQGGFFDDSILGTLIGNVKFESSGLTEQIKAFSSSPIPQILNNKICNDTGLTNLAYKELQNGDTSIVVTAVDLAAKKQDIWNFACLKDPNDPQQAALLKSLDEQNADIGGGESLLAITGGSNAYTAAINTQLAINKAAEEAKEIAKADLAAGGGIKSLTKCIKRQTVAPNGQPYTNPDQAPCIQTEVIQAASILSSSFKESLAAPLNTAIASLGVTGVGSLISSAFQTFNLIQGITNSVTGVPSNNQSNTTGSTAVQVDDLANNPVGKKTLTGTPIQQLLAHQTALEQLAVTDNNYIAQINYYQGQVNSMVACYAQVAITYSAQNNPRVLSGFSFASSTESANASVRTRIDGEIAQITTTKQLIQDTIAMIQQSQSSEGILALFNSYNDKVNSQNLPSLTTALSREGDLLNFKNDVEQSLNETGALYSYRADCAALGQEYAQAAAQQNNGGGGGGGGQ